MNVSLRLLEVLESLVVKNIAPNLTDYVVLTESPIS
jgi:hypothetical protein